MRSQPNICNIPLLNIFDISVTLLRVDLAANLCKLSSFSDLFTILYHTCSCYMHAYDVFVYIVPYHEYEES